MKAMIFTSSPNKDGLTAACGEAAKLGAQEAGAEVTVVDLNDINIGHCKACGSGWGTCSSANQCQVKDDFQDLHNSLNNMEAFVFVTPVYWGDMSESAKAFFDRLRRCEAWKKEGGYLQDKPVIAVAAAGGSGNGAISCLSNMERFLIHVKAERFDFISITRKSRSFKLNTIRESTKAMVSK
jgi:multimeric flavodoxin WrbA